MQFSSLQFVLHVFPISLSLIKSSSKYLVKRKNYEGPHYDIFYSLMLFYLQDIELVDNPTTNSSKVQLSEIYNQ
jgi:hypothetical protein